MSRVWGCQGGVPRVAGDRSGGGEGQKPEGRRSLVGFLACGRRPPASGEDRVNAARKGGD